LPQGLAADINPASLDEASLAANINSHPLDEALLAANMNRTRLSRPSGASASLLQTYIAAIGFAVAM
jgi:hypothetical protein